MKLNFEQKPFIAPEMHRNGKSFGGAPPLSVLRDKTNLSTSRKNVPTNHIEVVQTTPEKAKPHVQNITVAFKSCLFKAVCPFPVSLGEYIVVECDRGERCGKIVALSHDADTAALFLDSACAGEVMEEYRAPGEKLGKVVRVATEADRRSLEDLKYLELHAHRVCAEKAIELNLGCDIIGCEFQFDRNKVTFFFRSVTPIDFRVLVRELYKIFGVRIWMQNVSSSVRNIAPPEAPSDSEIETSAARLSTLSIDSPNEKARPAKSPTPASPPLPPDTSLKPYFNMEMLDDLINHSS